MKRRTRWALFLSHWVVRTFAEPVMVDTDVFIKQVGLDVSKALSSNPGKPVLVTAEPSGTGTDISIYVIEGDIKVLEEAITDD